MKHFSLFFLLICTGLWLKGSDLVGPTLSDSNLPPTKNSWNLQASEFVPNPERQAAVLEEISDSESPNTSQIVGATSCASQKKSCTKPCNWSGTRGATWFRYALVLSWDQVAYLALLQATAQEYDTNKELCDWARSVKEQNAQGLHN